MEEAVCRRGGRGYPPAEAAGRGNAKLKRLVADRSLDKTMLQDVLRRKF